jgi:hypothetical protein
MQVIVSSSETGYKNGWMLPKSAPLLAAPKPTPVRPAMPVLPSRWGISPRSRPGGLQSGWGLAVPTENGTPQGARCAVTIMKEERRFLPIPT